MRRAARELMTMELALECHAGTIPSFAGEELHRLYGNIYSSLIHFRLCGGLENAHTYVARRDGEITALLLFRLDPGRVRVINEGMQLPAEEVRRFAQYIFDAFPAVSTIEFHAVFADLRRFPLPCQHFYCTEDYLLSLPDTPDAYLASLGAATRKNIRKHLNRLQRDYPDFGFQVYSGAEICEQHVRDIVGFNRIRMAVKNRESAIDDSELQLMLQMARECGLLCIATIRGRLCAGTLLFRFGDHYVSRINAHDPQYDDYRLGTLACYLSICECIRRGGRQYHFMWGRYAYKQALAGELCEFEHIAIYRSRWHMLVNARLVLQLAYQGYLRKGRVWLVSQRENSNGMLPRLITACMQAARQLKRRSQSRPAA